MNINWFTVLAQVINFLILVWLLKKFLYKPVLEAIDTREKNIVAKLEDAKKLKEEAKKEQDDFVQKNKQFEEHKKTLMDKAIADTNIQKEKLMADAKTAVNALQGRQEKSIADMQELLKSNLAQRTQQEVFSISRKALADLASVGLEEQVTNLFISRLFGLNDDEKQRFIDAFKNASAPILIQSAFDLQQQQQANIKNAVDELLGIETELAFKTAPQIISGIELSTNGYKLAWSLSAYLDSLQNSVASAIKDGDAPGEKAAQLPGETQGTKKKETPATTAQPEII